MALGGPVTTVRNPWRLVRNNVATADTDGNIAASARTRAVATTKAGSPLLVDAGQNALEIRGLATTSATSFVVTVWGSRAGDLDVRRICSVTFTTGTQAASSRGDGKSYLYGRVAAADSYWPTSILTGTTNEASLGIDSAVVDTLGYEAFWFTIPTITGANGQAVAVEVSGY